MAESKDTARSKFGIGEALLNHPIYGKQITEIFNLWKAGKVAEAEDAYFRSDWGKLDEDAKDRILLQLENDKLYKERLKNWKVGIKRALAQVRLVMQLTVYVPSLVLMVSI